MTTNPFIEAKVAEFDELLFVSCPTEEREPFFWRWTVEGKKTLLDFIRDTVLEARREGAKGKCEVDWCKTCEMEYCNLHCQHDCSRTAGEKGDLAQP